MSIWDLARVCIRRWVVVLAGVALTAGVLLFIRSYPGVHWAQTTVLFLAPRSTRYPNSLGSASGSLIDTAGLIEREIDHGSEGPATSSSSITLVDRGVRDGSSIRLPSAGGQWAYNFNRTVLDVQTTGPSESDVKARQMALLVEVERVLDRRQNEANVDPVNRITIQLSPGELEVNYSQGRRGSAELVAVGLGLGLSVAAAVSADAWLGRRGRSKTAQGRPPLDIDLRPANRQRVEHQPISAISN